MQQSKFSAAQIVAAIKKQESGVPLKEICRELGMAKATFYKWNPVMGHGFIRVTGIGTRGRTEPVRTDVCRGEFPVAGSRKPDRKKVVTPADKIEAAKLLVDEERCSIGQACRTVRLPTSTFHYKNRPKPDGGVAESPLRTDRKAPRHRLLAKSLPIVQQGPWLEPQAPVLGLHFHQAQHPHEGKKTAAGAGEAATFRSIKIQLNVKPRFYQRQPDGRQEDMAAQRDRQLQPPVAGR